MGKFKEKLMDIITFPFMCIAVLPMILFFSLFKDTTDKDWERAKGDDVIDDYEFKKQKLIEYWKSTGMIFDEYGNMTYEGLDFGNINQVNIIENYDALILKHQ